MAKGLAIYGNGHMMTIYGNGHMMTIYGNGHMMTIYGNGNGIPGDFLPLSHSVSILGQLEQLREHWRSFFQITLALSIVVRIKETVVVLPYIGLRPLLSTFLTKY